MVLGSLYKGDFPNSLDNHRIRNLTDGLPDLEEPNMRLDTGDSNRTILICM